MVHLPFEISAAAAAFAFALTAAAAAAAWWAKWWWLPLTVGKWWWPLPLLLPPLVTTKFWFVTVDGAWTNVSCLFE